MKDIIRLGDSTSHGGVVLEAFFQTDFNGKPIAGVGHKVSCPQCKGVFPIVEGNSTYTVGGVAVALDGMKITCGASLIASGPKGGIS
ncbi:PAAR domain-containing protein [Pseudomonas chlororaphis]|uniref:PAAR domain-containing protein n=1 Tax=Pseudomonas chlororaphis TaxID=587753 RepID=UPI0039E5C329